MEKNDSLLRPPRFGALCLYARFYDIRAAPPHSTTYDLRVRLHTLGVLISYGDWIPGALACKALPLTMGFRPWDSIPVLRTRGCARLDRVGMR
jgi:hypothetical protein